MTGTLRLRTKVRLPPGLPGAFDHGDVDPTTGRVFVTHTAYGTVDVFDTETLQVLSPIEGCPEGSGLICASPQRLVFAASRGAGKVLQLDPSSCQTVRETRVGPKPNGLAWDGSRGRLLVADVDSSDQAVRLIEGTTGEVVATTKLPGRPRWCVFDGTLDRFLVNIREPATVVTLAGSSGQIDSSWSVMAAGPHGLDLDRERGRAFVACDAGQLVVLDLESGREGASVRISGEPDAIWYNAARRHLYIGIADPGLIEIIDTDQTSLVASIQTEPGAKTSAFDVMRQRLFVFLPGSRSAAVFDVA